LGLSRIACKRLHPQCLTSIAAALRRYRQLTREIDIVDAWTVPAYTFAGLARYLGRVPVLLAGRRSLPDVHRTRTWYREAARGVAMRQVDAVVANSEAAAKAAVSVEGIDQSRVHVIRNAVVPADVPPWGRATTRRGWNFTDDRIVIGCVGTLQPGKGHGLLLEIASDLREAHPELRYVFVGNGPLRDSIEAEIRSRELNGIVVVHTSEPDARRIYAAFDIVVQASESEGLPNAVLEAAAAGLPIVATAVGGTAEIVRSEREAILVGRDDRQGLASGIERLIADPALAQRLAGSARTRSREFSVGELVRRTAELYLNLLAGRSGRPA
jgi:glycosyltransferase involved in cell wall biosynthesis